MKARDRDGKISLRNWPVFDLYQPDAIACYTVNGKTFIVNANEGDARDYSGYSEVKRVKNITLDPSMFTDASNLIKDSELGRLNITTALAYTNESGQYKKLFFIVIHEFKIKKRTF